MTLFSGYVAVDWSASAKPVRGNNSIWVAICMADGKPQLENPSTRQEVMARIETLLTTATKEGRRLILGFDFPFGYPEGTVGMLTGQPNWEAIWELIAGEIQDGPDNRNNRFQAAARLNKQFRGDGPFWGLPNGHEVQGLMPKKPQDGWGRNLPPMLRYAEEKVRGAGAQAQEVWKLCYRGSVGSQALTGIARLQELRWGRTDVQVWPFETLGEGNFHVLAEIYPSLISHCPNHRVKDAGQVEAAAVTLRELDRKRQLVQYLRAPGGMPDHVRHEEGAILGMHDRRGFAEAGRQLIPSCHVH